MYFLAKEGDIHNRAISQYICDEVSDLQTIPQIFGNLAYIIATNELYIVNSNLEWVAIK